ncbi:MAG: glycosyltransferase [Paraprevotella sp.]|nr:glycosyltransferase [Paraprevotella sp.]
MNILFVSDQPFNPAYGGIERVTDLIVRELLRRGGYEITYLCEKVKDQSIMEYDYPVKVVSLPYEGGFQNADNDVFYTQFIWDSHINLVVNQRGSYDFMDNVLHVEGAKTISVVHTVVDGSLKYLMASIFLSDGTFLRQCKSFIKKLIYPLYYYIKYQHFSQQLREHYQALVQRSSVLVLLSEADSKHLKRNYECQGCSIIAIPNPCWHGIYQEGKDRENVILYVGRLVDIEKKPIRMIKIWEKLYRKYQDWRLIIVGDGEEREKMERYTSRRGIERVYFEGQQTNVEKYYKKASFICLTSQFEGWGMALTEGMSFGCIPFTFDNYGAAYDIVDDNINGCLIHAFDLNEYANRLSVLMDDSSKREELSNAAREKSQMFSISTVVDKWENLFKEVYKQ